MKISNVKKEYSHNLTSDVLKGQKLLTNVPSLLILGYFEFFDKNFCNAFIHTSKKGRYDNKMAENFFIIVIY